MNFDDSIRGAKDGVGYVIKDPDSRLMNTSGSSFFEPSIPEAELKVTWMGITYARHKFYAKRIFIEGNSVTIISWIQDKTKQFEAHLFLHNIWTSFSTIDMVVVCLSSRK